MFRCDDNILKPKRYIQFNDLVFSGTKSIDEQSESTSLRESKTSRTFTHGSYVANLGKMSIIDDNTISLKIALLTNNWSEEHIQVHYDFIIEQLMTPGKLWAIQTGLQLVWCNAYVTSIQNSKEWVVTDDDYLVFTVEFDNPDGVWYKANEDKVFLDDYSLCDFIDMKASCLYRSRLCCEEPVICTNFCECCDSKCEDMCDMIDFCTAQGDVKFMNDFFYECNAKWRIVYNCERAKKTGKELNSLYPHALCDVCINDVFSGKFISNTVLDSHKWGLALLGKFKDPTITLNGNRVTITGEYDGVLTIDYTGKIKTAPSWECIEFSYKEVSLSNLKLCEEFPVITKGQNTVEVTGVLSEYACVYIDYESVTM